ncbi:MAG: dihydrolipoamide acetyltransferase family protein, partial [Myxococcales bacterium]
VPHFYVSMEVDMEKCVALRTQLKELGSPISVNDFILKAAGFGLLKLPEVNRSFAGDHIVQHYNVDVGMAVAIPDGLITPVLRDIDRMPLSQINAAAKDYAERARNKKLKPEEYQGGSVTVSNLGMYGVDAFLAIVNPPQSVIIAVGQVADRPAVVDGKLEVRKRMWLTVSCDHRVVDGALGARYLAVVKQALENPAALLV